MIKCVIIFNSNHQEEFYCKKTKTEIRKVLRKIGTGYDCIINGIELHKFYNLTKHPEAWGLRSAFSYKTIHEFFDGLQTASLEEVVQLIYSNEVAK